MSAAKYSMTHTHSRTHTKRIHVGCTNIQWDACIDFPPSFFFGEKCASPFWFNTFTTTHIHDVLGRFFGNNYLFDRPVTRDLRLILWLLTLLYFLSFFFSLQTKSFPWTTFLFCLSLHPLHRLFQKHDFSIFSSFCDKFIKNVVRCQNITICQRTKFWKSVSTFPWRFYF